MEDTTKNQSNRFYTPELKRAAVHAFLEEGMTRAQVIDKFDIASASTFKKWVIAYRREGESALATKTRGRPCGAQGAKQLTTYWSSIDEVLMRAENERLVRKLGGRGF